MDAGYREIWDLELDRYGSALIERFVLLKGSNELMDEVEIAAIGRRASTNTGEAEVCTHEEFTATAQLLDFPYER